jgi:hypothetical protein
MEVAFYLVHPEANADRAKLAAFRTWLLAETETSRGTGERTLAKNARRSSLGDRRRARH